MNSATLIYRCSFCSQKIQFLPKDKGRKAKCKKCQAAIFLLPNSKIDIRPALDSTWWAKVPKKIVFSETVGPMSVVDFVGMFNEKKLNANCEVKSTQHTGDQWMIFDAGIMPPLVDAAKVISAESKRIEALATRRQEVDNENKDKLRKFIKQAVSDGVLSTSERSKISEFASKAKLEEQVVLKILQRESNELIASMLADALEDGILAPDEEERIRDFSAGLGVKINPSPKQARQIVLSRRAWQLNMTDLDEFPKIEVPVNLQKKEVAIAAHEIEWNEIVELKRPKGTWIGDNNFLKSYGVGKVVVTSKRLLFDSGLDAKKATNASIQRVELFIDGIFCNRSTGKSVFLRFGDSSVDDHKFGLLFKRVLTNIPIQGFQPDESFVPDQPLEAEMVQIHDGSRVSGKRMRGQSSKGAPRFTFRVVGEHIGDRTYWIQKLSVGETIELRREPTNPYDPNAIEVCNGDGKSLGYLKREVAAWFAGLLDEERKYKTTVHRIRSDNSLVVGVYE